MQLKSLYESYFKQSLTNTQVQTLKILVWLITVQKTVKIERLAACFPLPIKYESRRRHIQRFLTLFSLSLPLFWFPIIMMIIQREFSDGSQLILTIDRTQWKNNNIFVIAVIYKKRALPIYWQIQKLWESLPGVYRQCAVCYTDFWSAYAEVLPSKRHRAVGKETGKTSYIERFNCTLRQRVSRLVRKTLSFSKKLENHIGDIWHFIHHYNASLPIASSFPF